MNKLLKDFASFVLDNKISEFVTTELAVIDSYNIPLMAFFSHLSAEQLHETTKASVTKFLSGIKNETLLTEIDLNHENYKKNGMPGIPKNAVSLVDLVLIYSAQKVSFQQFIKDFTTDVTIAVEVMHEIEMLYKIIHEKAVKVLETIKEEEQTLRIEIEERFKDLFDNAGDMVQIVGVDGIILSVNKTWNRTMGYSDEDLKGKAISDFVKNSEKEEFIITRQKIINGNAVSNNLKTCYVTKSGAEVTVEGYITTKFRNGKPIYTTGILRDITLKIKQENELLKMNKQLAEREEYANQLIFDAPDAVIVVDAKNIITLWNPKAEAIFGWKAEEVTGTPLSNTIIPHAFREAHAKGMERLLKTGKGTILNKTIELTALHKNGDEFPISLTLSQLKHAEQVVFISFIRDITTQKENEIEIVHKTKQLQKSNEELEQFAWLTSHDLKEPLRKILTFSDVLMQKHNDNLPDSTLQYLKKIHTSAFRMNNLIEAILMYSNVEDTQELFVECDLNLVLEEVIDDLELIIKGKQASINTSSLPVVKAIPIQMRQLFQNLITNALKYSKTNEASKINITCSNITGGYKIIFSDNGIGFENAYADKIFQVFQRLLTNKGYEGTGIGLALCKKIMENHKGTIRAESELGKGSRFVIELPAIR